MSTSTFIEKLSEDEARQALASVLHLLSDHSIVIVPLDNGFYRVTSHALAISMCDNLTSALFDALTELSTFER